MTTSFMPLLEELQCALDVHEHAIAIVDGTGASDDTDYSISMGNSFCRQMYASMARVAYYDRGPSADGLSTRTKGETAGRWLVERGRSGVRELFVAGYSRGGSAAVYAARTAAAAGYRIRGMFLFDPVARHVMPGGENIPANVDQCWIAWRSDNAKLVREYEPEMAFTNPMRPSFGHMRTLREGRTQISAKTVDGSHGALGGVGWRHVREDAGAHHAVINFMNSAFASVGLPGRLKYFPPDTAFTLSEKITEGVGYLLPTVHVGVELSVRLLPTSPPDRPGGASGGW